MGHTPHELHEEFPEFGARLTELKVGDPAFAQLADAYHGLNRTIHRVESGLDPVSDDGLEALKKQRLAFKDEIYGRLIAT